MDFGIYDFVDTDPMPVSLPKSPLRRDGRLSCIDAKSTVKYAAPVIPPKVARRKTTSTKFAKTSNQLPDAKKSDGYRSRYRVQTFEHNKKFKALIARKRKRKRYERPDENCKSNKQRSDGSEQESGGETSQAETKHQKRVNVDGSYVTDGSDVTSCEWLLNHFLINGYLP